MREERWSIIPIGGSKNTGVNSLMLNSFPEKHFWAGSPLRFYQSRRHRSEKYRIHYARYFNPTRINFMIPRFAATWTFHIEIRITSKTGMEYKSKREKLSELPLAPGWCL